MIDDEINLTYTKVINPYFEDINKNVGTEAELTNQEIDARVIHIRKPPEWKLITLEMISEGDKSDLRDELVKEMSDTRKDRLGLNRRIDIQNTHWSRTYNIDKKKVSENKMAEEPPYPFGPSQPIYAFYANDGRDVITFFLRHPDNTVDSHTIDKGREHFPAWHHITKIFTADELEKNTREEINKINRIKEEQELEAQREREKIEQEKLFQLKVDAFEMPIVNDSPNRELKSMIRKAKNEMELYGAIGALYAINYMNNEDKRESAAQ